jgi:hypothetical protein
MCQELGPMKMKRKSPRLLSHQVIFSICANMRDCPNFMAKTCKKVAQPEVDLSAAAASSSPPVSGKCPSSFRSGLFWFEIGKSFDFVGGSSSTLHRSKLYSTLFTFSSAILTLFQARAPLRDHPK